MWYHLCRTPPQTETISLPQYAGGTSLISLSRECCASYPRGNMEKNSAACAMEWSIELDKGIRSNKPGRPVEAILQIGPRLEQWSKEPSSTMGISNIFGLVPGEDRLFANAILLRLAEAFKSGDKQTRECILKVFLLERRHHMKGKQYKGILSRPRVPNYEELLKRVKIVFDKGDVESRAITLQLIGCWSDIAKDSAEIRHMILLSLGSCHVLEVRASIFAAGCFSELSEDFAYVFLEVIINMVTSSKTLITVKTACAKAFAKLGCSSILASRAYKTGKKLVQNSSEEEFIVKMLISLSKLASKSMLRTSEQVEVILSFVTHKSAVRIQAIALRCMLFLFVRGVSRFPVNANLLAQLFHVVNDINLPTVSQCQALRILLKIFRYTQPCGLYIDMSNIAMWMSIVENAIHSPILCKRLLALHLLVDLSLKCRKTTELLTGGNGSSDLPPRVLLLVLDQLAQLVQLMLIPSESTSKMTKECQRLLSLVLLIIEEYPSLGVSALNKVRSWIECLVTMGKGGIGIKLGYSAREIVPLECEKPISIASQFVLCMYQFVECCAEALNEVSGATAQVHNVMKLIVEILDKREFLSNGTDICTIPLILLHSRIKLGYLANNDKEICNVDNIGVSHTDYWIENERIIGGYVKKILARQDYWASYKAGKCAACQGAWFAAAFTFRQLPNNVQSNAFQHWLKSLALFSRSESTIMLISNINQGKGLVDQPLTDEIWAKEYEILQENVEDTSCNAVLGTSFRRFNEAYRDVCSAGKMLAAVVTSHQNFIFQRWFLNVRAKVFEIVVDVLKLLNYNENNDNAKQLKGCTDTGHYLACSFTLVSFRLNRLAQELDLLGRSFMDMDLKSHGIISRFALNCSLLAFCTGFALYFPSLHSHENSMWGVKDLKKYPHSILVQDLVKRLGHIDSTMCTDLTQVWTLVGEPDGCFNVPPVVPGYKTGQREQETLDVCKFAISGFVCMLEEAKETKGGLYSESKSRLQFLSDVLQRWMGMSFQVPKYFFQVRSCIGAELFVFNADTRTPNELSVFQGSHLSLNLCLQLKHVPASQVTKMYCILTSKPSYFTPGQCEERKGISQSGFHPSDTNDAVDLNEKLWIYMTEHAKSSSKKRGRACSGDGFVCSYMSFVLDERGQGFSTCLLDVSAFPIGSYRMKWHSCCIDSAGSYRSLVPLNIGPVFCVKKDLTAD